jgi:hypothetical protein
MKVMMLESPEKGIDHVHVLLNDDIIHAVITVLITIQEVEEYIHHVLDPVPLKFKLKKSV